MTVQKLCWEAGGTLFRTSRTSGARDDSRMQRYWRDLCAFRSNGLHQFDFRAHVLAQAHVGLSVEFMYAAAAITMSSPRHPDAGITFLLCSPFALQALTDPAQDNDGRCPFD